MHGVNDILAGNQNISKRSMVAVVIDLLITEHRSERKSIAMNKLDY